MSEATSVPDCSAFFDSHELRSEWAANEAIIAHLASDK